MRGDAGDIDLEDGFLLAFLGHGEGGKQGRKHGDAKHEDSGAVELFGGEPGVVPETDGGLDWRCQSLAQPFAGYRRW